MLEVWEYFSSLLARSLRQRIFSDTTQNWLGQMAWWIQNYLVNKIAFNLYFPLNFVPKWDFQHKKKTMSPHFHKYLTKTSLVLSLSSFTGYSRFFFNFNFPFYVYIYTSSAKFAVKAEVCRAPINWLQS